MMEKEKGLKLALGIVLLEILLLSAALYILALCPALGGADYTFTIKGRSMNPVLIHGDTILIKEGAENIRVGDIISFRADSMIVTHRVVDIQENPELIFHTKGDACNVPDEWRITEDQVIGKVRIIPTSFLITPYGIFVLIVLPTSIMLMILVYFAFKRNALTKEFNYSTPDFTTIVLAMTLAFSGCRLLSLML